MQRPDPRLGRDALAVSSQWLEVHVHTRAGSADSSITVDMLGERAAEAGVGGILVAEHFRVHRAEE